MSEEIVSDYFEITSDQHIKRKLDQPKKKFISL